MDLPYSLQTLPPEAVDILRYYAGTTGESAHADSIIDGAGLSEPGCFVLGQSEDDDRALALAGVGTGHGDDGGMRDHLIGWPAQLARRGIHVHPITGVEERDHVGVGKSQRRCHQADPDLVDELSTQYSHIGQDLALPHWAGEPFTVHVVD